MKRNDKDKVCRVLKDVRTDISFAAARSRLWAQGSAARIRKETKRAGRHTCKAVKRLGKQAGKKATEIVKYWERRIA